MNDKLIDILKDKPLIIPRLLFNNYKKLNITDSELIILIFIINNNNKILYDPEIFVNELFVDKYKVMEIIDSLLEKHIVELIMEKNNNSKIEEFLILDNLYNKLTNIILEIETKNDDTSNIFSVFEKEFGRSLSPIEYEIINNWIQKGTDKELILSALKESVYNGVSNLRYIDKILYNWDKKGYKTVNDVSKDINNYNKQKEVKEVFDYNWLDDE